MQDSVTTQELFNACHVLFGREIDVSVGFLNYLRPSGIRSAYRERALKTHPDRAAVLSGDAGAMERGFKELNEAYDRLSNYVENPSLFEPRENGRGSLWPLYRGQAKAGSGLRGGRFYSGPLPPRPMPLGRFLYFSGAISFDDLIASVVWQNAQHMFLGQLAVRGGFLGHRDVVEIISLRRPGERFGECAVRRRLLERRQLDRLLAEQKCLKPLIGSYFRSKGILSADKLSGLLSRHYSHNFRHRKQGSPA